MVKGKLMIFWIAIFLIPTVFFLGCESGSSGGSGKSSGGIQVLPSAYDFGVVTLGNSPVPLEVKIINNSSKFLQVSEIVLSDMDNFDLDLGGGSNPCNTSSPTIGAGDLCTMEVFFQPLIDASYGANLRINTTNKTYPLFILQLGGICEQATTVNVRINQVESDLQCPSAKVTAYVSVTDQGGYAVTGLLENNFLVYEAIDTMNLTDLSFASQITSPISVALVMDYSGSITDFEAKNDMEAAVAYFIDQLGANDEVEIIKFAEQIEVVQGFTTDKNLLKNAIYNPVDVGWWTRLYDASWQAVDDTASRLNTRKSVVILSDGRDRDLDGNQLSSNNLSDVINHANDNNIPIFTVGLGAVKEVVLRQMADDTGGQFFNSPASDNLKNIYAQLADVLFENQYILEYFSALGVGETADLTIEVQVSQTVIGDDTKEITPCP